MANMLLLPPLCMHAACAWQFTLLTIHLQMPRSSVRTPCIDTRITNAFSNHPCRFFLASPPAIRLAAKLHSHTWRRFSLPWPRFPDLSHQPNVVKPQ